MIVLSNRRGLMFNIAQYSIGNIKLLVDACFASEAFFLADLLLRRLWSFLESATTVTFDDIVVVGPLLLSSDISPALLSDTLVSSLSETTFNGPYALSSASDASLSLGVLYSRILRLRCWRCLCFFACAAMLILKLKI